jgi:hypothetical protein
MPSTGGDLTILVGVGWSIMDQNWTACRGYWSVFGQMLAIIQIGKCPRQRARMDYWRLKEGNGQAHPGVQCGW